MRVALALVVASAMVASAAGGAVELSDSNFDDLVLNGGKNAFVKFLAPW